MSSSDLAKTIALEGPAADRTPSELEALLAEKFGHLIRDAQVTVTVWEATSQRIYLIGEVRREQYRRAGAQRSVRAEFCTEKNITEQSFHIWRKRLRKQLALFALWETERVRFPQSDA